MSEKEVLVVLRSAVEAAMQYEQRLRELMRVLEGKEVEIVASIESVQDLFPDGFREMLEFEDAGEYIVVRPRRYLGSDNFTAISAIVRDNKGKYVSAGRDSHFRIPKTENAPTEAIPEFDSEDLMKHEWKGRKTGEGQYAKGSKSWGWDFVDNFSESTIETLRKGPLEIDQYTFTLGDRIVQAKKRK